MRGICCTIVVLVSTILSGQLGLLLADVPTQDVPRIQRERADEFLRLLQGGKYVDATKLFESRFRVEFPVSEVKKIWELYVRRGGPFLQVISYSVVGFQGGDFLEIRGRWEKAIMRIRLSFDEENRIDGFWLARDREGPTPKYFKRGGYLYGSVALRTASLDHELTVRVVDASGQAPETVAVVLWRRVTDSGEESGIWDDPATGSKWSRCRNEDYYRPPGDKTLHGWKRLPTGNYRVTATPGRFEAPSVAMSDPFPLDETHRNVKLDLRIPEGPSLAVHVVDSDTGKPIQEATVQVKRKAPALPPQSWLGVNEVEGVHRLDGLLPARYSLRAFKPSYRPDQPKYVREPNELEIVIVAGEDQEVTVSLKRTVLTQEEIDWRWPWIVEGTVTDLNGEGMEGVEVRAFAGRGPTIFCGGKSTTDRQGRYKFRYAQSGLRLTDPPPLSVVGGRFYAVKEGYVERNFNRHARMRVASRMPVGDEWLEYKIPQEDRERIAIPGEPKKVDFVMLPEVTIAGRLVDGEGKPIPKQSLRLVDGAVQARDAGIQSISTNKEGRFELTRIPPGHAVWLIVHPPNHGSRLRSHPLSFAESGQYKMLLRLVHDEASGISFFEFSELTNVAGVDVRDAVIGDAPLGRPPVDAELQAKGQEILTRLAEVNRYWLDLPPEQVREYRYRLVVNGEGPGRGTRKYVVQDDSGWSFPVKEFEEAHSARHGVTYYSAIHALTSNPRQVSFRQVEIGEDEIRLIYRFPHRMWQALSYCHFRSLNGFYFSHWNVREGQLVIDAETMTPKEHTIPWLRERFSGYAELEPGFYVPRTIHFDCERSAGHYEVALDFRIYEPGLWLLDCFRQTDRELLDRFRHLDQGGPVQVRARIEGVQVNGKPDVLAD